MHDERDFVPSDTQLAKLSQLEEYLRGMGAVAVAFSGGVDSTFLLAVAAKVLGEELLAVTGASPLVPAREHELAVSLCDQLGVRQLVVPVCDLESPAFAHNPPERCYLCKKGMLQEMMDLAKGQGFERMVEGSNVDDLADWRPGFAAVRELGVASPLLAAGMTKQDIRDLSRFMGLPTWDKPSFACLASRFPYGTPIDAAGAKRVMAAEGLLHELGLEGSRVRSHGDLARIEVPEAAMEAAFFQRARIEGGLKDLGYTYVSLDLGGYRTGSMNEGLRVAGRPDGYEHH